MDNTEVTVVETTVAVGLKDQLVVTVLGAIVGLVAESLTKRAYYAGKARYQLRKSN